MAKPILDTDKDKEPIDPAVERVRRKLVRFVVINLGLLLIALMAVVLAVVYKSRVPNAESPPRSQPSEMQLPAANETLQADIFLPAGAKILSQSLSGNHISLLAELPDGSQMVLVYDMNRGRVVGRFPVKNR